jgi:hypothetical protein
VRITKKKPHIQKNRQETKLSTFVNNLEYNDNKIIPSKTISNNNENRRKNQLIYREYKERKKERKKENL